MKAGEFIALLFMSRDYAHREHLKTTSYAEHKALNGFYDSIVDLADSLSEMVQGRLGERLDIPYLDDECEGTVSEVLKEHLGMIEKQRFNAVRKDDTAIQNKIDEIVGLYLSTLYLLTLK